MEYLLIILGFMLLYLGTQLVLNGLTEYCNQVKITTKYTWLIMSLVGNGMTISALVLVGVIQNQQNIVISALTGFALCYLLGISGIGGMIKPLVPDNNTRKLRLPYFVFAGIIIWFLSTDMVLWGDHAINKLSRVDGMILVLLYLLYLIKMGTMILIDWKEEQMEKPTNEHTLGWKNWKPGIKTFFFVIMGIAGTVYGSKLVMNNVSDIGSIWGISDRIIGLVVLGIGSSIPVLYNSLGIVKTKGRNYILDASMETNIFTLLFLLGIVVIIHPVNVELMWIYDMVITIFLGVILWSIVNFGKGYHRLFGCGCVSIYIAYIVYNLMG